MESKHTPGPWQVAADCGDTEYTAVYDAAGRKLALVVRSENARLVAAAPDLLAALVRAQDHLILSGIKCDDAPEALAQARAAIDKARGATPADLDGDPNAPGYE